MKLLLCVIGTILALIYIIFLLNGHKKFSRAIAGLNKKEHFFLALYPAGLYVLSLIRYSFASKRDQRRIKECQVVYGEKYGSFYYRINLAAKIGVILFLIPIMVLLYPVIDSAIMLIFYALVLFFAWIVYDSKISDIINLRSEDILNDFPTMLSKLSLLVEAGMTASEAWNRVSETGTTPLYQEMQRTRQDIANGTEYTKAYVDFGERCLSEDVKKFASAFAQNFYKGNKEMVGFLRTQNRMSWEEKKHTAKRKGEKASGKLLIPIMLIFMGIMLMILIPIFANIGFSM